MTVVELRGRLKRVDMADVEIDDMKTKGLILYMYDWNNPYQPTAQLRLVLRDRQDWAELRHKLEEL